MSESEAAAKIEAAVAERLQVIVAEQQKQFAQTMEMVMKNSLGGVDQVNAELEKERESLREALDDAQNLKREYENQGEKLAQEAYNAHQKQYAEAARTDLLRQLTVMHIEVGKTTRDIAVWLDVPQDFVENIRRILKNKEKYNADVAKRTRIEGNPKISYRDMGRGGYVIFESRETRFELWWEFAIGGALALVEVPSLENWQKTTQLPLEKRADVLNFIGEQVVLAQTGGGGSFIVGENVLTIYSSLDR